MTKQLSSMKYCYREIIKGCFRTAYENYGMTKPPESEDQIVDFVIEKMKRL